MHEESSFSWDTTTPLDKLAEQSERLYYSMDTAALQSFPREIEDRCWEALATDPRHATASQLLFNVVRSGTAEADSVSALAPLKQLLDVAGLPNSPYGPKIGNALLEAAPVRNPLRTDLERHRLTLEDLYANPLEVVETIYPVDGSDETGLAMAGVVLAGIRGLMSEGEEAAVMAVVFGLQEAVRFYMANLNEMGDGAIRWLESRLPDVREQLPPETREELCELLQAIAFTVVEREHFAIVFPVLTLAKQLTDSANDQYARCLYMEGEEYERQQKLDQAITCYEAGLATDPADAELRGVLQVTLGALRLNLLGDFSEFVIDEEAAAAYGFDPQCLSVWQNIAALTESKTIVPRESLEAAVKVARQTIEKLRETPSNASRTLHFYVVLLKLGLELTQQYDATFPFATVIEEADPVATSANQESRLAYEPIRREAMQRSTSLSPAEVLLNAADILSQAMENTLSWDRVFSGPSAEDKKKPK